MKCECTKHLMCDQCVKTRDKAVTNRAKVDMGYDLPFSKPVSDAANASKGLRYNANKLPVELVPASLNMAVAAVLEAGARKYARRNWEKGINAEIIIGCLERHLLKYKSTVFSDLDPETGLPHLFHIAANVAMLIENMFYNESLDDRHKSDNLKATITIDAHEQITYNLKNKPA